MQADARSACFPRHAALCSEPGVLRDGVAMTKTDALSQLPADLQKLEAELDPEMQFRPLLPRAAWLVAALLLALSCFHYYTAGFGLLPETTHRGIHIAFVLGLIFLVFSWRRSGSTEPLP